MFLGPPSPRVKILTCYMLLILHVHTYTSLTEFLRANATIILIPKPAVVILHIFTAHARKGHISTSGLKSDITIVFLDPDIL